MPVVSVDWFAGRTKEQKQKVVTAIEDAMQSIGVPEGATYILFRDTPAESWGIKGKLKG